MYCRSPKLRLFRLGLAATVLFPGAAAAYPLKPVAPPPVITTRSAKPLPQPQDFSSTSDRALINDLLVKIADAQDEQTILPVLDDMLTKLREPSLLRGLVQYFRASTLGNERLPEALDAVEESIRLLPDYSAPLITAATLYAYSNEPGKGADYFLRAVKVDPDSVRQIDDYEVNNIVRRLTFARDDRRAEAVSDALLDIGWIGNELESRSALAWRALERRVDQGDFGGARAVVPKITVPRDSYALLIDKKYAALWSDLETWAGPQLRTQWASYLREARDRWTASKDTSTVRSYLGALRAAGHDRTIIRDIVPLFYDRLDDRGDQDLQFVVSGAADALAREGRWSEVDRLFRRAQEVWPLREQNPNSLNVAANRARFLLFAGRTEEALAKLDEVIDLAQRWKVNPDAIATMHHYRACTLHELGRDDETAYSIRMAVAMAFPSQAAGVHLCTGNREAALRALLDGLKSDSARGSVLSFVQKESSRPMDGDYSRKMRALYDGLRSDPKLLAEVAKYGRILPYSDSEGAPAELP